MSRQQEIASASRRTRAVRCGNSRAGSGLDEEPSTISISTGTNDFSRSIGLVAATLGFTVRGKPCEQALVTLANPRILIVEDESSHATLIQRAFEDLDPTAVLRFERCLAGARKALAESRQDLVVVDYVLPDGLGVELLPNGEEAILPVIVMTSHGDERTAVDALKAGAFDYVIKSPESLAHIPHVAMRSLREWHHIVERKRAEELAARFGQILEASSNEIYFFDSENLRLLQANRGAMSNLGYPQEELVGLSLLEILPSFEVDLLEPLTSSPGKQLLLEADHKRRDGSTYPVEVHLQAAPRDDDESVILAVVVDCTEKRENEAKQQRLEEQLRRAKRLEAVGTLAGGVAHDFNNLLAPILGYSEMALVDLDPASRVYSDLEHILKAARRAKELVQQLLVFSRQSEPEHKAIDVGAVLDEAVELIRSSLEQGIIVELHAPEESVQILADETQILMMIFNLCTNAAQAMAVDGGTIEVTIDIVDCAAGTFPRLKGGNYVVIAVEDTGTGMDSETLERIFDPFFTTKGVLEGTGLGLSVVHGIVTSHEGVIQARSKPGKGSRFEIYLPLLDDRNTTGDRQTIAIPDAAGLERAPSRSS